MTGKTQPLIRQVQEARETRKIAFQGFYAQLLQEFDKDRDVWLKAVRYVQLAIEPLHVLSNIPCG